MMDLAVLGTDLDVLSLATAAVAEGHRIVWIGDVRRGDESALRSIAGGLQTADEWETLLDQGTADAVLVGAGEAAEDLRAEQLKRMVADQIPLLVVHPAGLSVLTYYELDMIRRENGAVLRHYHPLAGHPVLEALAARVQNGDESIGEILQITCSREVRSGTRQDVLAALARDAEILAAVGGDIRRVSAVGPQSSGAPADSAVWRAPSFASLQVQMTTPSSATMRWSAVPIATGTPRVELTLVGERGSLTWDVAATTTQAPQDARLHWKRRGAGIQVNSQNMDHPPWNPPQAAIQHLASVLDETNSERRRAGSTWSRATVAMEVVDAVELSLQKGRSIEVHQQQLTEQLAFRGTMAALGCGLLLVSFIVMLVVAFVGGVEWFLQKKVIQGWAIGLLAVLGTFLALQFVPYLSSKRDGAGGGSGADDGA